MELVTGDWYEITYVWGIYGKTTRQCKREPVLWVGENRCVFESGNSDENFSIWPCTDHAGIRKWTLTWAMLNVKYLHRISDKWEY